MARREYENTFAEDIEAAAGGEPIIGIVIGPFGWGDYVPILSEEPERKRAVPQELRGKVLTWEQARPWLNYKYDRGYGAPDCHAIFAWTENRVIFVDQYDGATSVCWVPRHPTADRVPYMPGGG